MIPMRAWMQSGAVVLGVLALTACAAAQKPQAQTPQNNPVVRSVTTMTGSTGRARDAAAAMNQSTAASAAAANALQ